VRPHKKTDTQLGHRPPVELLSELCIGSLKGTMLCATGNCVTFRSWRAPPTLAALHSTEWSHPSDSLCLLMSSLTFSGKVWTHGGATSDPPSIGGKVARAEVDHSSPYSAELRTRGPFPPLPHYPVCFHSAVLKHNFSIFWVDEWHSKCWHNFDNTNCECPDKLTRYYTSKQMPSFRCVYKVTFLWRKNPQGRCIKFTVQCMQLLVDTVLINIMSKQSNYIS
jgi:hypothetical protein